ncbi:glycosyltransferase family 4 protein [Microbacterium oleivorans]|uniref:Glycosyl transferase n=1 Tax=Microbacterium oleivorans TaxID=273677 RepID=A0A177K885_9MICO|nr:glycosyltransferase family 4 protein [Microbacterium oleivorans]OAH48811.1 glycosyl transferase [Microbacterium oleivorans]
MTTPRTVLAAHPGAELFGSDRMFRESVAGLIDGGSRVVVAIPTNGPLIDELRSLGADVVIAPGLVLRKALLRPSGWIRLIRETFRGLGSAWRIMRRVRPDAVYVSTITIPLWPLIARLRRASVISHVHEAEASGNALVNRLLYLPHLLSDEVLVNSRFSQATIRHVLPNLAARTEVVLNGVVGPTSPSPLRAGPDGALRVLYMGRLSPRKGPDLVISAAALLAGDGVPVDVTLVGDTFPGYEWFGEQLRLQAESAPERMSVRFAGFQPDVWSFVADTDVVVVPSRIDEPFGNTAVEAVLGLRPVVVADTSGLREAADGYTTARMVPVNEPAAISDQLRAITESWASVRADVERSRAEALRRHAPESYRAAVRRHVERAVRSGSTSADGFRRRGSARRDRPGTSARDTT